MRTDYRDRLAALGFSNSEVNVIEFISLRVGLLTCCEHERPRFVECHELDADQTITEMRWRKAMIGAGFREDAVILAEHALGLCEEGGKA